MFDRGAESDAIFLAKAIGIILVVAGHYQISAHDPAYWAAARKVIYTFHMPLFMGLAGYLFGKKYNFFTDREYFFLLAGKAKRLLLPYLTLSCILLLIKSVAGNVVQLKQPVGSDFLKYLLVNPMGGFSTFL
jgi:fucose 4-O-acetylase-like acetyltransferase